MGFYDEVDATAFVDQSPKAQFSRQMHGTIFRGASIGQFVGGMAMYVALLALWAGCLINMVFNGLWFIALAFVIITIVESRLPGQLKFAGDVFYIACCYFLVTAGLMTTALIMGPVVYLMTFAAHKLLFGDWFVQQKAYLRGLSTDKYRRNELGLPAKTK